ncbi:MAG: MgtC/SapB family protein [Alphaproteobacteria bacterium]|nr:MgtC/SapB family protein [Alphaproteobacteria bacterium]
MSVPWLNLAVALALGVLIGIERERSKGEGATRRPAGIRTFALATTLGAIALHLGGVPLLAVATAAVGALAALSYLRSPRADPGLTTEIALLAAPLIGALAMSDMALAAALGTVVAVVLATKAPVHRFVKSVLTGAEVNSGLAIALATLVVWPQLPDRYLGPFAALNPHTLWLVVILVLAIGACGHVAARALGPRAGLPLAGFAGGFVSSTAVIGAMGGQARRVPETMHAAVAAATLSTVATFVQMALLLVAVSVATLVELLPALLAGGVIAAAYGLGFTLRAMRASAAAPGAEGRAFSPATAAILAATLAVMLVVAAALKALLGDAGIVVAAAVAGIVDTHSAAVSVASLVASTRLAPPEAVVPILAAMSCNALAKTVMALGAGSAAYALRIIPGLVASMAASWAVALLVPAGGWW